MESLFFNTPNQCYKITKYGSFEQVDISNGMLFFDINTKEQKRELEFNYVDKMLFIILIKKGSTIVKSSSQKIELKSNSITTFVNSNSKFWLNIKPNSEIFILFVADFFLKRYLSFKQNEPIDFIYSKIKISKEFLEILQTPLDAFSLYLVDKIKQTKKCNSMQSIKCMYRALEFIVHNLSMVDIIDSSIDNEYINIAQKARDILLKDYITPPTINQLAKKCATNEFKLKKAFKSVYKTTIYSYIQRLRLEKANLLLKEDSLTIKEVANSVGYTHSGYFAKLFFKTYGVYPKDIKVLTKPNLKDNSYSLNT